MGDSRNLPIEKREAIHGRLVKCAVIGVGIASVEEIDTLNIYWARMLAMTRAVEALVQSGGIEPAWVLVDGNACPRWQRPSKAIVAAARSGRGGPPAPAAGARRGRWSPATRAAGRSPLLPSSPRSLATD